MLATAFLLSAKTKCLCDIYISSWDYFSSFCKMLYDNHLRSLVLNQTAQKSIWLASTVVWQFWFQVLYRTSPRKQFMLPKQTHMQSRCGACQLHKTFWFQSRLWKKIDNKNWKPSWQTFKILESPHLEACNVLRTFEQKKKKGFKWNFTKSNFSWWEQENKAGREITFSMK